VGGLTLRLRTLGHLTVEAVTSVRDNSLLSVAAISTVAISLLVLAIVTLLAVNMHYLASVLDAQVQVVAYLDTAGTTPAAAAPTATAAGATATASPTSVTEGSIRLQVAALPGVTRVDFISKDQALQNLAAEFGNAQDLLAQVQTDNPLPDSLDIYVGDPRQVAGVAAAVLAMPGVGKVQNAQDVVNRLLGFTQALRYVGLFLVAALALTTLVVIGNTVRVAVYARREQIGIMKLVGATDTFIRFPFFIEGAILGVTGALISALVVSWGYGWLHGVAAMNLPFLPLMAPTALMPKLVEALVVGGLLLGALGSALSVRRHLNV